MRHFIPFKLILIKKAAWVAAWLMSLMISFPKHEASRH